MADQPLSIRRRAPSTPYEDSRNPRARYDDQKGVFLR